MAYRLRLVRLFYFTKIGGNNPMHLKDKMYYKKNPELRRFVNDVCVELLGIISKKIDNGGLGEVCVAV